METIFTEKHRLRDAQTELHGGKLVFPFERPSRAEYIIQRVRDQSLGAVTTPEDFGMGPILSIHADHYVDFLQTAWAQWKAEGFEGEAIASSWPARRMSNKRPRNIDGLMGYYALAAETSLTEGTWDAVYASAQVALTGALRLDQGAKSAFALCRPPGHHATADMYGGYCFLNNAAIAAQYLRDKGAGRVAILDIDFHHGNGTQDIFYDRDDVLFISLHGDPMDAFPYFLGHADEIGTEAGCGYTLNLPMAPGTAFPLWRDALSTATARIVNFKPDALVVSLGVDTFESDPISFFKLRSDDFRTVGRDLTALNTPTLFVMEGGYDIAEIGINAVNVLQGFKDA
ncbi:MAG: histone deacetylase family protein [Roseobacter sp.]